MNDLTPFDESPMDGIAQEANQRARANRLRRYQLELSQETLRRQRADLSLFARFIYQEYRVDVGNLSGGDIQNWQGISYGMVEDYKEWQIQQGYALSSIGVRLATVHAYATIALELGIIPIQEYLLIKNVKGPKQGKWQNINEARRASRRPDTKREEPVVILPPQVRAIRDMLLEKAESNEKQERLLAIRDLALFSLMVHQGFRVGEVVLLRRDEIHLESGLIIVHRHKTHKDQTHEMHSTTLKALRQYLREFHTTFFLFEGKDQDAYTDARGKEHAASRAIDGIGTNSIYLRVRNWGEELETKGLAPHGLRHSWLRDLLACGTSESDAMEAGGWNSPAMVRRYRGKIAIANKGVKQSQ